jgi:hypothetical protein
MLGATVSLFTLAACGGDTPVAPTAAPHAGHVAPAGSSVRALAAGIASFVGRYLETPLGAQPRITPNLRIERPSTTGRVPANLPVTIRVRYEPFDNRPELRTPNAGATLGSESQVLTDGYVQGHMHGYLQRLPEDGRLPAIDATSFCVLERIVERRGYAGVVEGECPAVPPGEYRLSAEFQTNSHTAILKDGPRAGPTADVIVVRVR